ncbi:MAG: hypothetical protein STHCBS139747_003851 [Sporothrix thermara]
MFAPSNNKKGSSSPLLRPDSDALSLHSAHADSGFGGSGSGSGSGSSRNFGNRNAAFFDTDDDAPELFLDDNDELPPLYSDVVNEDGALIDGGAQSSQPAAIFQSQGQGQGQPQMGLRANFRTPVMYAGEPQKWRYEIMPRIMPQSTRPARSTQSGAAALDDDVRHFLDTVNIWARYPPRPYVQLRGTHSETVESDGKKKIREVVDFDVKVDLTPFLYHNTATYESWSTVQVATNRDKVRRGTIFRRQAPGMSGPPRLGDEEQAAAAAGTAGDDNNPTLEDWCRRFCEDPSRLRSFQLERRMTGFNHGRVRKMLERLVRSTNYRGGLQVTFPVDEVGHVFYNAHRFNEWRLSKWIRAFCVLTLMIIFTWPYLYFTTKRYEVVTVDWPFSRITVERGKEYVSLNEDQWYNLWARAIAKAVLAKRQGTLDQVDLRQAEGAEPTFGSAIESAFGSASLGSALPSTGNSTVDGAVGVVRAGINAMNMINRQNGWGYNC